MTGKNFIKDIRNSSLLEIVEKSFPTEFGKIEINRDNEAGVVIVEAFTKREPRRQIAKVTFTNFEVKCESQIDFPHSEDAIELRFIDLMSWVHEDYINDWKEVHNQQNFINRE